MQLGRWQAAGHNCTRSFPPTSAVYRPHRCATTRATARRGPTAETFWQALADWTSAGSPPNRPRQRKATGGDDEPEDQSRIQVLGPVATQAVQLAVIVISVLLIGMGFLASLAGILAWHGGLATEANLTATEGRLKESVNEVKKSVGTLQTLAIVQAIVGAFVAGVVLFKGK